MLIGYGRVSTQDQDPQAQVRALEAAGCERIFYEKVSGKVRHRPELEKLLHLLRPGDSVVLWKINRLGRNRSHLFELADHFRERGIHLVSLTEGVDTSTATGRLVFGFLASMAEWHREEIVENTRLGLAAARAEGRIGGRPKGYSPETIEKIKAVKALADAGRPPAEIQSILRLKRTTYYDYLKIDLNQEAR